jgi:hypothetical protein
MEENRIPKIVLYMNLGTARLRGRPKNRWQDEVKENGRKYNSKKSIIYEFGNSKIKR